MNVFIAKIFLDNVTTQSMIELTIKHVKHCRPILNELQSAQMF